MPNSQLRRRIDLSSNSDGGGAGAFGGGWGSISFITAVLSE